MTIPYRCALLLTCLLPLLTPEASQAQDTSRFRAGLTLGGSTDFYRTDGIRYSDSEVETPFLGNEFGHSYAAGLVAEYRPNRIWGITAHIDYVKGWAEFSQKSETAGPFATEVFFLGYWGRSVIYPESNDPRADASYEYRADLTYRRLDLDLIASRILYGSESNVRFGIAAGPAISLILDADLDRDFFIEQDVNDGIYVDFTEMKYPRITDLAGLAIGWQRLSDENIEEQREWLFGLRGGFFASIGSLERSRVIVTPGLYFDYRITKLSPEIWNPFSLMARVDAAVNL